MTGIENGKIKINDPNSIENSNKLWNFDDISSQINNLWGNEGVEKIFYIQQRRGEHCSPSTLC